MNLKNKEIAYKEFEILREQRKKGGTGEINDAIGNSNESLSKRLIRVLRLVFARKISFMK